MDEAADAAHTKRAIKDADVVRGYAQVRHRAGSWSCERHAVACIEATCLGLNTRFVVTNVAEGTPAWIYKTLCCARGQAENLIKPHKSQLRSDRTTCRSTLANPMRPVSTPPPIGSC